MEFDELVKGPPYLDKDDRVLESLFVAVKEAIKLVAIAKRRRVRNVPGTRAVLAQHMNTKGRATQVK